MSNQPDLVIRNGTLVDGTGGDLFEADIEIRNGLISSVGAVRSQGREEIDARDHLVTPGFVDVHTHYDAQATWAKHITPSSFNGVTTVLMGNCGVGFAPVRPDQHEMLIELMEGVEDIPEVVLSEGLPWTWESFPDYLDALAEREFDVDIATQVPHAALRVFVMGERGARREPATDEDISAMAALAAEGVRAGAFGFSTSRLLQHRTASGEPIPSYGAAERELREIANAVAKVGSAWIQVVADFGEAQESEFELLRRLVEASGLPLTLTLLQRDSFPNEWRELLDKIAEVNARGHHMTGQTRGRPTSTLHGFELSRNPFSSCPSWAPLQKLPFAERVAMLRRDEVRAQLIKERTEWDDRSGGAGGWMRLFPLNDPPQYEPEISESIGAVAKARGVAPAELAFDAMMVGNGKTILYRPTTNYAAGNMDPVFHMLQDPNTLIGLGDGGAHVGVMCDATDMTHALTHWTRDRKRGGRLPIPDIVRRLTFANANAIGLADRGQIRPGLRADLNVIDYDRLQLCVPEVHYDLPAGGKRLLQRSVGYKSTVVNGRPVWRDGEATGAYPGRLLRSGRTTG